MIMFFHRRKDVRIFASVCEDLALQKKIKNRTEERTEDTFKNSSFP